MNNQNQELILGKTIKIKLIVYIQYTIGISIGILIYIDLGKCWVKQQ